MFNSFRTIATVLVLGLGFSFLSTAVVVDPVEAKGSIHPYREGC